MHSLIHLQIDPKAKAKAKGVCITFVAGVVAEAVFVILSCIGADDQKGKGKDKNSKPGDRRQR